MRLEQQHQLYPLKQARAARRKRPSLKQSLCCAASTSRHQRWPLELHQQREQPKSTFQIDQIRPCVPAVQGPLVREQLREQPAGPPLCRTARKNEYLGQDPRRSFHRIDDFPLWPWLVSSYSFTISTCTSPSAT